MVGYEFTSLIGGDVLMKKLFILLCFVTLIGLSGCSSNNSHSNGNHHSAGHDTKKENKAVKVDFSFEGKPESGKNSTLSIQVNDKKGKAVKEFELEHEKLMHLIIVNKELSYFKHVHPEYKGGGLFTISLDFPTGGEYKLFTDFVPKGSTKIVKSKGIEIFGNKGDPVQLKEDQVLTKVNDGKEINLKFDQLKVNKEVKMTFTLNDANTKQPITDLEQYLGAVGHVVAISADSKTYLHVHPMNEKSAGPSAEFMTTFPKKGLYKIWGQFQHNGTVFIVPFTVDLK